MSDRPASGSPAGDLTSFHVRRAVDDDRASVAWIVARFSPLLLLQARQRLAPSLKRLYEPDDVVADVWITVLGALGRITSREGSMTQGLLSYASTVLIHRIRDLLEKHVIGKPAPASGITGAHANVRGVVSHLIAEERRGRVWAALEAMDPRDREIVVLRGIEGKPQRDVAALLDLSPENVAVRYHRALKRLRERLPGSVFSDLEG